ncbi:MAG TPA: hypothetical protein VFW98_06330 [Gemmatimonadaceae bacterium]|nr:hypothetical protein [Gemmatimonadaceae bacterium]
MTYTASARSAHDLVLPSGLTPLHVDEMMAIGGGFAMLAAALGFGCGIAVAVAAVFVVAVAVGTVAYIATH